MAIEEPPFTVESKTDDYEIRNYEKVLVAETVVRADFEDAGNAAFRILADFIFGKNNSQTKIPMTAPVTQQPAPDKVEANALITGTGESSTYRVQFMMPKEFRLETLPTPVDQRIQVREVPTRKLAVHRYSGTWTEANYLEELAKFRAALTRDGVKATGEPTLSRFNSPFSLWFLRRNEIWLEIE